MDKIVYSNTIPGAHRNWNWPTRFDLTGGKIRGCLGITQWNQDGTRVNDRVLLSPAQVKELIEFVGASR